MFLAPLSCAKACARCWGHWAGNTPSHCPLVRGSRNKYLLCGERNAVNPEPRGHGGTREGHVLCLGESRKGSQCRSIWSVPLRRLGGKPRQSRKQLVQRPGGTQGCCDVSLTHQRGQAVILSYIIKQESRSCCGGGRWMGSMSIYSHKV